MNILIWFETCQYVRLLLLYDYMILMAEINTDNSYKNQKHYSLVKNIWVTRGPRFYFFTKCDLIPNELDEEQNVSCND